MPKLIVEIPEGTHRALKQRALEEQRTLRSIVKELVDRYLIQPRTEHRDQPTGLCGSWQDDREADAIIADVRDSRQWRSREVAEVD